MTTDKIKVALRTCLGVPTCKRCPLFGANLCTSQLHINALEHIESLEKLLALKTDKTNRGIDPDEFLSRLHEWQAHAVINELTESKAVFDISIAIVEDMVKECNNDND